MTSKEETMESARAMTAEELVCELSANKHFDKTDEMRYQWEVDTVEARDNAIIAATEAKVREEYAGLVERAYREGWNARITNKRITLENDWNDSQAKAALEGKVSQ
jgi:hypothetical protein